MYYGQPYSALSRLQKVQNILARLVSCVCKFTHITSILMKLHWLTRRFRLLFKILLHVFKVVKGVLPSYFDDFICKHTIGIRNSCTFIGVRKGSVFENKKKLISKIFLSVYQICDKTEQNKVKISIMA